MVDPISHYRVNITRRSITRRHNSREDRRCVNFLLTIAMSFLVFPFLIYRHAIYVSSIPSEDSNNHISLNNNKSELVIEKVINCTRPADVAKLEKIDTCTFKGSLTNALPELKVGASRQDNNRMLRIYDHFRLGSEWENLREKYNICIATQSTLERLYWLPQLLEHWSGPLSLALHLTSVEEWLIFNLFHCYLSRCHPSYKERVALHLSFPSKGTEHQRNLQLSQDILSGWKVKRLEEVVWENGTCPDAKKYLNLLVKTFPIMDPEKLALKEVYPQNHLRNIARKGCSVPWTLSTDIDVIPREGMADMLQKFYELRNQGNGSSFCKKCAYVIPVFELKENLPFPKSKNQLVRYYEKGEARAFQSGLWIPYHGASDTKLWASTNLEEEPVKISHVIGKPSTTYEPFYVSADEIPAFDERFLGYDFDRSSQFREAYMAGWNFTVLTPVFSIHWGLKERENLFSPKQLGIGRDRRRNSSDSELFDKIGRLLDLKRREGLM